MLLSSRLRRVGDDFRVFLCLEYAPELSVHRGLTILAAEIGRYALEAQKRTFSICLDVVCMKMTLDSGLPRCLCEAVHRFVDAMHGKQVNFVFTGITLVGNPLLGKDIWFCTSLSANEHQLDREGSSVFGMLDAEKHTIVYPP
eukprot:TRINITY_DN12066_c0_g1_i1.p2 TRINITY_DN12066_c0_g1~~TRINITY_DN12066_c0_g1_i1.p2  ORF type:complete len:143 (+),score=61.52 TRINITY_DN12066_c0_g1_i1:101-529(+)